MNSDYGITDFYKLLHTYETGIHRKGSSKYLCESLIVRVFYVSQKTVIL